jgi:hypothetical protein
MKNLEKLGTHVAATATRKSPTRSERRESALVSVAKKLNVEIVLEALALTGLKTENVLEVLKNLQNLPSKSAIYNKLSEKTQPMPKIKQKNLLRVRVVEIKSNFGNNAYTGAPLRLLCLFDVQTNHLKIKNIWEDSTNLTKPYLEQEISKFQTELKLPIENIYLTQKLFDDDIKNLSITFGTHKYKVPTSQNDETVGAFADYTIKVQDEKKQIIDRINEQVELIVFENAEHLRKCRKNFKIKVTDPAFWNEIKRLHSFYRIPEETLAAIEILFPTRKYLHPQHKYTQEIRQYLDTLNIDTSAECIDWADVRKIESQFSKDIGYYFWNALTNTWFRAGYYPEEKKPISEIDDLDH